VWDRIFTASLAAYSLSLVIFLLGNYVLDQNPMTMTGIALMGVTAVAMGISGFVLVMNLKIRG
jgi:hypothetical protein